MSKEAKTFAQFLRDMGRDLCWSILCLQEFIASNGEVVTQRRLAIVVAAKTIPCVIGGSFCLKGGIALLMSPGWRRNSE